VILERERKKDAGLDVKRAGNGHVQLYSCWDDDYAHAISTSRISIEPKSTSSAHTNLSSTGHLDPNLAGTLERASNYSPRCIGWRQITYEYMMFSSRSQRLAVLSYSIHNSYPSHDLFSSYAKDHYASAIIMSHLLYKFFSHARYRLHNLLRSLSALMTFIGSNEPMTYDLIHSVHGNATISSAVRHIKFTHSLFLMSLDMWVHRSAIRSDGKIQL